MVLHIVYEVVLLHNVQSIIKLYQWDMFQQLLITYLNIFSGLILLFFFHLELATDLVLENILHW